MREVRGKAVVVAGMGRSGVAAVVLMLRHGALVRAADQRTLPELGDAGRRLQELGVSLLPQGSEAFDSADLIVLSPGVPSDIPELANARSKGTSVIGEVELASYYLAGPVIGITGANGKTTTTSLIGHILRETGIPCQVGGNIGTAPTAMIDSSQEDQWNVLELSSFQLETIEGFHAKIAVCVNVTPDHLDRHGTYENYANAKARLFETQHKDSFAVLNADNSTTASFAERTIAEVQWFSSTRPVSPGVFLNDTTVVCHGVPLIRVEDIPLRGLHNVENTMAAALAAQLAGAPVPGIGQAIRTFPGVEHRLEFVRDRNGVAYYNDSKATNVDATEKAIDAFHAGIWIILGGKDKNSDFTVLRDKLQKKARGLLLIGAAANTIATQLEGLPIIPCGTIEKAVEYAAGQAVAGETVLLAPACASFDQFDNYEHRGRVFKDLVKGL